MPARVDAFHVALNELRRRLRNGSLVPGSRLAIRDIADQLGLSQTPVREAMARLSGEGMLLERRGSGFSVPVLSGVDIADHHRLRRDILLIAQAEDRAAWRNLAPTLTRPSDDPIHTVEQIFQLWAAESGSRILVEAQRMHSNRLITARRVEARLIEDLVSEAEQLSQLIDPGKRRFRPAALAAFHARRIELADQLARLLDPDAVYEPEQQDI